MTYIVIGCLAMLLIAAFVSCRSCLHRGEKEHDAVPADIAEAKLQYYSYTRHGTTRWPMHYERVERLEDDSTKCVIRLFDINSVSSVSVGEDEPIPDTLVVSSDVLDHVKQLIIEAQAWKFKDYYRPRMEIMDGWSWGFSADFGSRQLTSGGSNESPRTDLFDNVREYLNEVMRLWNAHS